MMDKPLDELYLEWLYRQVASLRLKNPTRTYWRLLRQLYTKEFVWLIPNDDNRVEDGRDLRYEFLDEIDEVARHEADPDWLSLGCSMLEMMIGLARCLAFEADGEARDWFWHMMENVDLRRFNDAYYKGGEAETEVINEVLDTIIWRTYHRDGHGGLFPLRDAAEDQREVELWYQLNAYLLEQE